MEKEEEEHYYRLICLVVDIGTGVLLNLFKKCIPTSQTPEAFLNNRMHIIYPPKGRKVLNELQYKALTVAPIDMSKFDITLLCVLIRNLTNIQTPTGGWDIKTPLATDASPGALIINLRGIRNTVIAHRSKGKLTKSEFEKYWRETEGILVGLAGEVGHAEQAAVKKKIEQAKIKQLVEDPKGKVNELAIGKLQEDYSDLAATVDQIKQKVEDVESMKGDVSSLKSSIEALELQMQGLEKRMTQTDDEATKVDQQLDRVSADMEQLKFEVQKIASSLQEHKTEVQNRFEKVEQRLGHVSAAVQKNESSLQELGTDIQKVDQGVGHVSAAIQKNESSLQELGTDVQKVDQQLSHVSAAVQKNKSSLQELGTDIQKVEQRQDHVSAAVQKNESSLQELGTDIQKVDQRLGHVSAAVHKNESSLQELGTDVQKIEQRQDHLSAAVQKNESSLQKVDQRQGHLSTTVQELQTDVQKLSAITILYDSQEGNKKKRKREELDETVPSQPSNKQFKSSNTADSGIHTESDQHDKARLRRLGPGDGEYEKLKQNLRKEIMDHYRLINCCKTAIPALIKCRKTDVNEVFVMPTMRVVEPGTSTSLPKDTGKQPKYISTIHEMFISKGEAIGKVYLRGEAGTGKTTLCQKIVSQWCNVHRGQQTEIKADEEKFLKNIELLFYIPLRNHRTSDIIEMIKKDVVREFQYDNLDLVLKTESKNCLIILDGLDEWTPLTDCRHKVPYIDPREKFTVLTTSRPWKLEVLRPEMCDLGQIELCELDQDHLIEAVVNLLNSRSGKSVDWRCFRYTDETSTWRYKEEKETYKKIQHLADIPVILTAMVCMWHDGEEIATTRIQAYGEMVEYLMNVAVKRNQMMGEPSTMMEPQKSTATEIVDVFKGYPCCEMHSNTLFKLSDLAYHTLFNTKKENSLVFPHLVTEMYNLTDGDVKFCLYIGLLSQSEFYGKASSDMKCISFLHKTLQEFFAAIFIAHGGKELLQPMKTLNDVFEMAEVLIFVSGLRPDWIGEISHHIAELTDRDDRILRYRNSLREDYGHSDIVNRVQTMIHDCIVEVPTDRKLGCKVELYDVFNDINDDASINICTTILPYLNTEHIKSLWADENYLFDRTGHKLVSLKVGLVSPEDRLKVELEPAEDRLEVDSTFNLSSAESNATSNLSSADSNSAEDRMEVELELDIQHLVSVIDRCSSSLSVVSVDSQGLPFSPVPGDNLITSLYRISHLTCLRLMYMEFTHLGIVDLVRFLSTSTQLREIDVRNITCTTCGRGQCEYTVDLSHHRYLQYLKILYLEGDFVLSSDTPLEYCDIHYVKCGPSIVNRLRSSTTLQVLMVRVEGMWGTDTTERTTVNTQNQGVVHSPPACRSTVLTQVIPTLMNLRKLTFWRIDFKQDILRLSPGMTSLEKVEFLFSAMTLQCVQGFIDSLPQTECTVSMYNVTIRPTGNLSTAVKNITDRHQGTGYLSGQNFIENDQFSITFTSRPSHSK